MKRWLHRIMFGRPEIHALNQALAKIAEQARDQRAAIAYERRSGK